MTEWYEWGYTFGPPMAVSPIDEVIKVLDYGVTEIPSGKILMGVPNYGYDWKLPYVRGESRADSLSSVEAMDLAREFNVEILFDEVAMTPYFYYTDYDNIAHVVWFEDARSVEAKILLPYKYDFEGISYWNVMKYFPQNWLVVNNYYDIKKYL